MWHSWSIERKAFAYEYDKLHYGPFAYIQSQKEQNVPHEGTLEHDIWQRKRLKEECPSSKWCHMVVEVLECSRKVT